MRRSERIQTQLRVRWMRRRVIEGIAADINLNGIFLRTDELTAPGSFMQLEIHLPDGVMTVFGAARFVGATQSGVGIGVEFVVIDERARVRWNAHYEHCAAEQGIPRARLFPSTDLVRASNE